MLFGMAHIQFTPFKLPLDNLLRFTTELHTVLTIVLANALKADDQVKTGQTNLYCASGAAAGCERSRSLSVALQGAIRAGSEKSPGSSSEKQHQSRGDKRENQVR